ncbi:MAG TPA: radical SAM protein [Spirochaetota bacterium]|nr:radical SAM protein [Spirochaetota bacterium]
MKIVCAYLCEYRERDDYFISLMPSGVASIASYLEREGHSVTLANLSEFGAEKGAAITIKEKPDAVTVSIFSFNRHESCSYINELKKRNKDLIIIAGGQHPTFLAEQVFSSCPELDYIVSGEGEIAASKILASPEKIKKGSVIREERIKDLDSIPCASDFSGKMIGVNPHEQFRYIITTRGCPSSCTYCSSPYFWERKVTYRSPENIVNELKFIQEKYGIIYFSIRDDNFTLNKKRVMEFCRLLNESGIYMMWNCQARVDTIDIDMLTAMKSCGLEHIQFGIESGSERILKLYEKSTSIKKIKRASEATRKAGVYLSFYLMAGMHGETEKDIDKTVSLMHSTLPHDSIVSPVAYYPGTALYSSALKEKKINHGIWQEKNDSGLYLIDKKISDRWIKKLLRESIRVSSKAIYRARDFSMFRKNENGGLWLTAILEGDYYLESGNVEKALLNYRKVIEEHPENIWGYLKSAEALYDISPDEAIKLLQKTTKIVPSYNGALYSIARLEYECGNIKSALKHAEKALKLNPYDTEIKSFIQQIRNCC